MSFKRHIERAGSVLLIVMLGTTAPLSPALIVVGGGCTLPDAVEAANTDSAVGGCTAGSGADTIRLTSDVELTSSIPTVTSEIIVDGQGSTVTSGAGHSGRFFTNNSILTLFDVTLSGASADDGGAIRNTGTLTVEDAALLDNEATSGNGGAIWNDEGLTTIINSTLSNNEARDYGGGVYSGFLEGTVHIFDSSLTGNYSGWEGSGFMSYGGELTISGSTVSGNQGAGVVVFYAFDPVTITNSTISGNGSRGLHTIGGPDLGGTIRVENTTFYDNSQHMYHEFYGLVAIANNIFGDPGGDPCADGFFDDEGGNVDSDGSCAGAIALSGLDTTLADNGGPTRTHALLAGSSAIDAAGDCGSLVDQRGFGRDSACDAGSFEFEGAPPVASSVDGLGVRATRCANTTTGERVDFVADAWNCRSQGLAIETGDRLQQSVRGRPAAPDFTGSIQGVVSARVECRNFSSGQAVRFSLAGAQEFSCRDQGLLFSAGDFVGWRLGGFAE